MEVLTNFCEQCLENGTCASKLATVSVSHLINTLIILQESDLGEEGNPVVRVKVEATLTLVQKPQVCVYMYA